MAGPLKMLVGQVKIEPESLALSPGLDECWCKSGKGFCASQLPLRHTNALQAHLPYIFPSSDRMILRRPQGGYIASASWKLCSMSGLHTPSASPSMALSSSSLPSSSPCSGLPLALHLLDAMVPAPTGPWHEPPRYTNTARKKQGKRGGEK